jgi:DNA polymerase-1
VLLAFTDADANFRKDVYPAYKSNRKGHRKPVTYQYGREYAKKMYDSMTRPELEADDILGILATGNVAQFIGPKVVCSIDKDMRSFPCKLYNWMKPNDGIVEISEEEADLNFYTQILTGDSVDGYPGCPGIGPVKAAKILKDAERDTVWGMIREAYAKKKLTEEDALDQARCARILRAEDYDFTKKKPILWTPTTGEEDADIVHVQSGETEDGQG